MKYTLLMNEELILKNGSMLIAVQLGVGRHTTTVFCITNFNDPKMLCATVIQQWMSSENCQWFSDYNTACEFFKRGMMEKVQNLIDKNMEAFDYSE